MKRRLLTNQQLFWLFVSRQAVSFGILVWLTVMMYGLPDPRLFYAMVASSFFFALFALSVVIKAIKQNRQGSK